MAYQNDDQSLLHSQARIMNYAYSFVNSMSLKCALELQIPDIINRHGAPMLLSELVEALSINKDRSEFVYRLMRILVHSGFFVIWSDHGKERGGYLLTPTSRLLLTDEPLTMRPLLVSMLDPILMDPWQNMSKWFQSGGNDANPFQTTYGMTVWHLAAQEPKLNQLFNEAMGSDGKIVASVLRHCRGVFEGLDSIVDVAGGIGTLTKCIAEAFPSMDCVCFDLPHVVEGLEGSKNLSYVGGDMFEAIPKAHAIMLKWILHDWSDKECIKLLKLCKNTIPSKENGGKVIIIDMVVKTEEAGDKTLETQLFLDMFMMTLMAGKERTEKEWEKLFRDTAFSDYKITPILGVRSLIELYP